MKVHAAVKSSSNVRVKKEHVLPKRSEITGYEPARAASCQRGFLDSPKECARERERERERVTEILSVRLFRHKKILLNMNLSQCFHRQIDVTCDCDIKKYKNSI